MWPTSAVITPTCTTAVGRAGPGAASTSKPKSASASCRPTAEPRRCSMTGSKRTGLVVQERDRQLLSELAVMRIIDREMTKQVAGFSSTRRANARLLQLTRTGLLRRFFVGSIAHGRKAVYTLSPKGGEIVAAKLGGISRPAGRLVTGDAFVEHQTNMNGIYLAVKHHPAPQVGTRLRRWITFRQSISEAIKLTPDGYFEFALAGVYKI